MVEWIRVVNSAVQCYELQGACRAFGQSPVVMKEAVQVVWQGTGLARGTGRSGKDELLPLLHFVGVFDQITSSPLVTASSAFPVPTLLAHPKSCASRGAPSGGGPKATKHTSIWIAFTVSRSCPRNTHLR